MRTGCAAVALLLGSGALHAASPQDPQQSRAADKNLASDSLLAAQGSFEMMSAFTTNVIALSPRGRQPIPPCRPTNRPPTDRPSGGDCRPSIE